MSRGKGEPPASPSGPDPLADYRGGAERAEARALLEAGREASFGGFAGAALPFFLAAVREPADAPYLVVTASEDQAEELREELQAASGAAQAFPAWESLFIGKEAQGRSRHATLEEAARPDGETYRDRLESLLSIARPGTQFVVLPVHAAIQPVPAPEELRASRRRIAAGDRIEPSRLALEFEGRGFRRVSLVEGRGEYSLRGDILDFFPYDGEHAVRAEFFGEMLEAIRAFNAQTQKSIPGTEGVPREFYLLEAASMFRECFRGGDAESLIFDHLPPGGRVVLWEPAAILERAEKIFHNLLGDEAGGAARERFSPRLRSRPVLLASSGPAAGESSKNLDFGTVERFRGVDLERALSHLEERMRAGFRVTVFCENAAEGERFIEILRDHGIFPGPQLAVRTGPVRRGFSMNSSQELVLTCRELFNRQVLRRVRRREAQGRPIQTFLELSPGDYVVHLAHGIGRFRGTETLVKEGVLQEFLAVEFRGGVVVYVPVSKIDLIQKYVGSGGKVPLLDRVGGTGWGKKKESVERALVDLAADLLEIQALRQEKPGIAYPADTEWQRQFEAAFPFEDTPDQIDATSTIKRDMESPRPMDRLLCGDVGYGKTELAMRAAFKAVNAGRQVAMLVPTTVLAQQHYRTFRERMAEFPVRVDVLSRFRSPREQREIVNAAVEGGLDVLIGTHRLLSGDVTFKNLGLVIIDEEQRFGVADKEKLKRIRTVVDILTMTATPIPRTLHMSLLGIRDISNLTTPPEGRAPVKTEAIEFDRRLVREVILRELNRDGQVYFVHNRVQDIDEIQSELELVIPEARIEHAHGQMSEDQLEEIMMRFLEREIDVLVSTTIIESGIDIPNVNTIFIDEADRYGLADLHQLRGRVGRGKHQAYCYLILPQHRAVNPDAKKRVQTLREFAELGAGFQIAMRDLEIRGSGNILGPEQSGHIALVGYEMYCRLLEKTVKGLRNEEYREPMAVEVDLNLEAYLPDEYLPGENARLEMYRRISLTHDPQALADLAHELEDRFGEPPAPARRLLAIQELRALANARGIFSVSRDGDRLVLRGDERMQSLLDGAGRRVQVLDPRTVLVTLEKPRLTPKRGGLSDEEIFQATLDWLRTGVLPEPRKIGTAPIFRKT